jgi:hypothetical protein
MRKNSLLELKKTLLDKIVSKFGNFYAINTCRKDSNIYYVYVEKNAPNIKETTNYYEIHENEFSKLLEKFFLDFSGINIDLKIKFYNEKPIYKSPNSEVTKNAFFDLKEYNYDLNKIADSIDFNETIELYKGKTRCVIRSSFLLFSNKKINFQENKYIKEIKFYSYSHFNFFEVF